MSALVTPRSESLDTPMRSLLEFSGPSSHRQSQWRRGACRVKENYLILGGFSVTRMRHTRSIAESKFGSILDENFAERASVSVV